MSAEAAEQNWLRNSNHLIYNVEDTNLDRKIPSVHETHES